MANFGKKAKLGCQKGTVKVECLVSVYETVLDDNGEPERYRVVVQRLQDFVDVKDAEAGLADAMPYITNRKQWIHDPDGSSHARYAHDDYVTPAMMDAIRRAAPNCHESEVEVEEADGTKTVVTVQHYCVKLDIGFNPARGEAFFYRIKSGVDADSLAKDIRYNMRHMPAAGRALTDAILDGHRNVTDIAQKAYRDAVELGKKNADG